MAKPNNLLGQTFGYLEVLERVENDRFGKTRWLCLCHRCGNKTVVNGSSLLRGLSKTCGCGVRAKTQDIQFRDQIKNEYCYQNNIPLLRIPYQNYNTLATSDLILETSPYLYKKEEKNEV